MAGGSPAHARQAASDGESGRQHADGKGRDHRNAEARDQRRIEHGRHRGAGQGAEEQHRQGKGADEGGQGRGRVAAQDAKTAGQVAGQNHPEDRNGDVEDGLHGLCFS